MRGAGEIVLTVHWAGGVHTERRLPKRRRGQRNSTPPDFQPSKRAHHAQFVERAQAEKCRPRGAGVEGFAQPVFSVVGSIILLTAVTLVAGNPLKGLSL